MSVSRKNAQAAQDYAEKKRLQLERARQIKEERKQNIQRAGEDFMIGGGGGTGQGRSQSNFGGNVRTLLDLWEQSSQPFSSDMDMQYGSKQGGMGAAKRGYYGGGGDAFGGGDPFGGGGGYNGGAFGGGGGFGGGDDQYLGGGGFGGGRAPVRQPQQHTGFGNGPVKASYVKQQQFQMDTGVSTKSSAISSNSHQQQQHQSNQNYRKAFRPQIEEMEQQPQNQRRSSKGFNGTQDSYYQPQRKEAPKRQIQNSVGKQSSKSNTIDYDGMGGNSRGFANKPSNQRMMRQPEERKGYEPSVPQQRNPAPTGKKPLGGGNSKPGLNPKFGSHQSEVDQQRIAPKRSKGYDINSLSGEAFAQPASQDLTPCPQCGRNFNDEAYPKHVKICKKVFQQKRKAFNSQAHRIVSNEQKQFLTQAKRGEQVNKRMQPATGNSRPVQMGGAGGVGKWKAQSEQFRAAMRAARGAPVGKGGGYGGGGGMGGGYAPPAPVEYDDRVQCQYCGRKFNETAAQRHIPYCKNKTKDINARVGPVKGRAFKR